MPESLVIYLIIILITYKVTADKKNNLSSGESKKIAEVEAGIREITEKLNTYQPGQPGAAKNVKDKWMALALCVFFGWFGVHRFYEGNVGMGFIYLMTLGICGLGWLYDIVRIASKPRYYVP